MNEFKKLQHEKAIERRKTKCLLCSGIISQPKARVKDFYEAMLDGNIGAPVICEVLEKWGIAASITTIQNHRRGQKGYGPHMDEIKKAAGL
jgi:hypothetical protein